MIGQNIETERLQHGGAADPEHDLLLEAIGLISAVEVIRDLPVLWAVLIEVGIEKQHRHAMAERTIQQIEPRPYPDLAPLDLDCNHCAERL